MSDLHNLIRNPKSEIRNPKLSYSDLLGKEYRHNGRGPDHYDCWGLCMEVYKRLGLVLPEYLPQTQDPACIHGVVNGARGEFVEIVKPVPYCLATFMVRPPYVTHVGVVLDENKFIHLMRKSRVTIERLDLWAKRIKGFYIYVGTRSTVSDIKIQNVGVGNAKG